MRKQTGPQRHKKPQSREKAVRRILYRNFLSVAYKGDQAAFDLVGTQRTFDFRLIVSDHKESLRSDLTDAVQDKDTLVTTVKNDIILRIVSAETDSIRASSRPGIKSGYIL